MYEQQNTGPLKKKRRIRHVAHVLANTIFRLKPGKQIEIPALFVFWVATLVLTFFSIYMWIFHSFQEVPVQSLITLWILVFFLNLCESYTELGDNNNKSDEFGRRKKY
jgi:high-affinity K+ transport system ATPase subunit B